MVVMVIVVMVMVVMVMMFVAAVMSVVVMVIVMVVTVMVMVVIIVMMIAVMMIVVALDPFLTAGATTSRTHRNSLLQDYSTSICFTCKLLPLSTCRAGLPQCGHPASCRLISTLALHVQHHAMAGK